MKPFRQNRLANSDARCDSAVRQISGFVSFAECAKTPADGARSGDGSGDPPVAPNAVAGSDLRGVCAARRFVN